MTGFLTVEDVNSVLKKYGNNNQYYELDTSTISTDEFNCTYDFIRASHVVDGSDHVFNFEIVNRLWTGGYYFKDSEGNYLDIGGTYSDGVLSVTTSSNNITLVLYLTNSCPSFELNRLDFIILDEKIVSFSKTSFLSNFLMHFKKINANNTDTYFKIWVNGIEKDQRNIIIIDGIININYHLQSSEDILMITTSDDKPIAYFKIDLKKYMIPFTVDGDLKNNRINTITLDFYEYLESALDKGRVTFKDKSIDLDFTQSTSFNVDLLNSHLDKIDFKLEIFETDTIEGSVFEFTLPVTQITASTVTELANELLLGSNVIKITDDLTFENDFIFNHDVILKCDDHTFDLEESSFTIKSGAEVIIENCNFTSGDPCFIQKTDSSLELINCSFEDCHSSDYNDLGSVVYCDVDLENLEVEDDFHTIFTECTFTNNTSAILHGGQLVVNNCKFLNNDVNVVNKHNVAFLYQVDGNASILNSVFDIDYTTDSLCTNEQTVGFAQALIKCGETARINNANQTILEEEGLPFFENFRNTSHVFVKYYYPAIEACVYTSPVLNKEDKCVCYALSGVDFVFKQNAQVTRADANTENTIRKITWE